MESGRAVDRQQEVSKILSGLKALARELDVPVIAVCQLNHSVETREGYTPGISDLRESGFVEHDADVVILLHREDYYDPTKKRGEVDLRIVKQKNGPTGKITLKFQQKFLRFDNF